MKKINDIISWFESDRDFESGKALYFKYGFNLSFKNSLNLAGNTPDNYKYLCYELAQIAGLSEVRYKKMLQKPLVKASDEKTHETKEIDINTPSAYDISKQIEFVNPENLDYYVMKDVIIALDLKPESRKKVDLISCLNDAKLSKLKSIVPDNVKRSIKLREEFPFLKKKECPVILKILVADMLTCYENYIEGHQKLMNTTDEKVISELSEDVVEDYLENRQIWDELNYYKEKGTMLGKHPLFVWTNRRDELSRMTDADLVKLRDQLKNKIPRTKKLISDDPDHKDNEKRSKRLEMFEKELSEVNRLLGIDE